MTMPTPAQTTVADLQKLGFTDTVKEVPRRLIASVEAREKCGKTHFSLTAAETCSPVWYFDIDAGNEGVVEKFQRAGFRIFVKSIRVPKNKSTAKTKYDELWQDLKRSVAAVFAHNQGVAIIDTSTEAFELARLAHFGKLSGVLPHNYTEVNNEWREFMRLAYDSTMSSIWIHKVKAQYINDKRTGVYELAGFNDMPYQVQANIVLGREKSSDGTEQLFTATIRDCRQNPQVAGVKITGSSVSDGHLIDHSLNWEMILSMIHD